MDTKNYIIEMMDKDMSDVSFLRQGIESGDLTTKELMMIGKPFMLATEELPKCLRDLITAKIIDVKDIVRNLRSNKMENIILTE